MKIQLEHLGEDALPWQEDIEVSREELDRPELLGISRIRARGTVGPVRPGYLLTASLAYSQTIRCDRCLEPTEQEVAADLSLLLLVEGDGEAHGELELEADDLDIVRLAEPVLEPRPILLEQVQLNVPMKPLCTEECAGLCTRCGENLNSGPCQCEEEKDPRWAALAALKDRLKS